MPYNYQEQRPQLFTESGSNTFIQIRDNVQKIVEKSGAIRMQEAIRGVSGDSWVMLACVDRMVELGELREISQQSIPGQHRIFVTTKS
jgi:hypothetical protein